MHPSSMPVWGVFEGGDGRKKLELKTWKNTIKLNQIKVLIFLVTKEKNRRENLENDP